MAALELGRHCLPIIQKMEVELTPEQMAAAESIRDAIVKLPLCDRAGAYFLAPQLFCGSFPEVVITSQTPRTPRGKWDFSSDEKLLEAHEALWDGNAFEDGVKIGREQGIASKNDWSTSIAGAIVMSVLLICATAIAIMRPEYFIDVHPIAIHLGDPIAPSVFCNAVNCLN